MKRLIIITVLLGLSGCTYARDRGRDLVDPFLFQIGNGFPLCVTVKATDLIHTGVGFGFGSMIGFRGRQLIKARYTDFGFLIGHVEMDESRFFRDVDEEGDIQPKSESCYISPFMNGHEVPKDRPWIDRAMIEVRAEVILLGLGVGVNPIELIDLVLGLGTIDIAGDDGLQTKTTLPYDAE